MAVVTIMTVRLSVTATTAKSMMTLEKDFPPERTTRFAMKRGRFTEARQGLFFIRLWAKLDFSASSGLGKKPH
jgi:hypothetical protein